MVSLLSPDAAANSEESAEESKSQPCESLLYNFGHAPFEVVQKFQDFCMNYKSLTEALLGILSREPLLKRKYHFIITPVVYQLLARPTEVDSDTLLDSTIDLLKKFTRRGRYDSVSNAIEELLFSPAQEAAATCDKGTWTCGNISNNFTELSHTEQDLLEKIADSLIYRIGTMKPPKKRKNQSKPKKESPNKKKKTGEKAPWKNGPAVTSQKDSKTSSNHLCLNSLHNSVCGFHPREPPDAQLAIPIKNFLKVDKICETSVANAVVTEPRFGDVDFLLKNFDLMPVKK